MHMIYLIILLISVAFFTAAGTYGLWMLLKYLKVLDEPTERSNHSEPTPSGTGLAMSLALVAFLGVGGMNGDLRLALLALAAVSFLDDFRNLNPEWRLLVQIGAVALGVSAIDGPILQGILPLWLDKFVAALVWLWFLNLYNFMDGIDGITSANTVSLCAGLIALFFSVDALSRGIYIDAAIIAAAVLAFAPFNWHPAKVFMGDAGSIPLGFLMGYLLLQVAADGYVFAALILPAFYVTDATVTLVKRMLRGEKVWVAHSQHYYQRAVRAGVPHDEIAKHIIGLNCILAVLAVLASQFSPEIGVGCLIAAYSSAFLLMLYLAAGRIKNSHLRHAPTNPQ